jgi:hypothetical protein
MSQQAVRIFATGLQRGEGSSKLLCIQILLDFQPKKFVSKALSSPSTKFIYELLLNIQ